MESNSISCIVTDPPYGLGFMNKEWDYGTPSKEYWKECFRLTKPGGYLLAMGGTRTFHRLASAIEDSGWEIRDCLMWLYGAGFPKSHNKFGIEGYGTALKPAYEPIIMAMRPCDGTFKENAEKWGQAGINIDGSRVGTTEKDKYDLEQRKTSNGVQGKGRWPANVLFDEEAAEQLDEQSGVLKTGSGNRRPNGGGNTFSGISAMVAEFPASSGGAIR
jgi:site-specific DNA-methyltransferase (adenine-specific)